MMHLSWFTFSPSGNPSLPVPFPPFQTFKQLSESCHISKTNTLSQKFCFPPVCLRKRFFLLLSAKRKKSTFFMGTNVESRYMQPESSSRLQYMSFSLHLKKSRTWHTGTGKCMKMSLSFDCSSCLLTWSLASRDCLGRLYSIKDIQYLLSKREITCKMSSSCDVSSK